MTHLTNLTSFTITKVSEEEERDSDSDTGPTVFENSVFVERDALGSRIYEFNPLYISDAMSESDSESRGTSLASESSTPDLSSTDDESTRSSVQVTVPDSSRIEVLNRGTLNAHGADSITLGTEVVRNDAMGVLRASNEHCCDYEFRIGNGLNRASHNPSPN